MAEREVESPSGLTGNVLYFRAPRDACTELISLYFEDLAASPVTCDRLEDTVKVTFSSNAALQKAAVQTSHAISDGCVLASMAALIPSSPESDALRSINIVNSAIAIEPTQAEVKTSATSPEPPNLTIDSREKGSGFVEAGKPIAVVTLDVDRQVHVTQYCIKELQYQVDDLNCVVKPLSVGMLLLEGQGREETDLGIFQQAAVRIYQYVDKFATLVVAVPDRAINENLRKLLKGPGNVQVSCRSIARCTSGWLYTVTCDKNLLSEVQALLGGTIPILHCSTRTATSSGTGENNFTGPYMPTEPYGKAGSVGSCRLIVPAHVSAMQLFNRHFVTQFQQAVRASPGSLPREAPATVACEVSGFVVQGSITSVTVAEQLLCKFLQRVLTEERWLRTDSDNRTVLLHRVAAVEDATRTTIVVLDEHLDDADSESSHHGRQMYAAATAANGADRGGAGEFQAGRLPSGRRLQLQLVQGSLAEQTDDILVNSVGCALRLSKGAISSSILRKAGESMQDEISKLKPNGITEYALVVTGGHGLSCKKVFHVACGLYNGKESEAMLSGIISECLKLADELQMKSIAFPAIGAGILQFPPEKVIAILHAAVTGFSARNLQSVKCIVFDSASLKIFSSTLTRLLKATSRRSSAVSANADIPPLGRFQMSVVVGAVATERSNLILHSTDKYLTLQDITSKNIEGAMGKTLKDELQTLRANGPQNSKSIRLKNRLKAGSQLVLLNTSEISSSEQWASVITSEMLYADQMKYQTLSICVMEEGQWNIDKCIPALLEAIAAYESTTSIIPMLKQVRIVVNAERFRLAVLTEIQKFLEHRSKSFFGAITSKIGKWVLPSAEKESGAAKAQSWCVLHISVCGTDEASIAEACRRLVDGVQPEFWQWQGRPSSDVPQAYTGSDDTRQASNQHESRLANARVHTDKTPRPGQENLEYVEKGTERSRPRHEDEQHALTGYSEHQYSKVTAGTSPPDYSSFSSKETRDLLRDENDRSQGGPKGQESGQLQQHYEPLASKDKDALPEGVLTAVHDNARGSHRESSLPVPPQVDSSSAGASGKERRQQEKHRVVHENDMYRGEKPAGTKPTSEQIGGTVHSEAKQQVPILQHPDLSGASAPEERGGKEVDPCSYDHGLDSAYVQHGVAFVPHAILPSEGKHTVLQVGNVHDADELLLASTASMQQPLKSHDAKIPGAADDQRDSIQELQNQEQPSEYQLQQRSKAHQQLQHQRSLYFEEQSSQQQQLGDHRISCEKRELGEQMAGGQQDDQQQMELSQLAVNRSPSHETPVERVVEIDSSEKKATFEVQQTHKQLTQLPEVQQAPHRQGFSLPSQPESVDPHRLWNAQKEEQALSSRQHRQFSASSDCSNQPAVFVITELPSDDVNLTHLTRGRAAHRSRRHPYSRPVIAGDNAGDRCMSQSSASQRKAGTGTLKCKQCGEESDFAEDAVCCPDCGASLLEK